MKRLSIFLFCFLPLTALASDFSIKCKVKNRVDPGELQHGIVVKRAGIKLTTFIVTNNGTEILNTMYELTKLRKFTSDNELVYKMNGLSITNKGKDKRYITIIFSGNNLHHSYVSLWDEAIGTLNKVPYQDCVSIGLDNLSNGNNPL